MNAQKYATLFGGSGKDRFSCEYIETVAIGRLLAERGYVVKNGGYGGMMEAVAKGVSGKNGQTIGITCKQVGPRAGNKFLSKTIVTEKLYERLKFLIEETDVFIVQKGGIGTLSEVFLALDILRKETGNNRPKLYFIGEVWSSAMVLILTTLIPEYEHNLFNFVRDVRELGEHI